MASKQIKELFEELKAKQILIPLPACEDNKYTTYTTANDWRLMITFYGGEWDALNIQERKNKIIVVLDVWDDPCSVEYSLDEVVEYRLFTETDLSYID